MARRPACLLSGLLLAGLLVSGLAAPVPSRAAEDWMFDPAFREGRPGDVLSEGPPPLLRAQLDAYVDLFQVAFDVALPVATEQRLRDALEIAYVQGSEADRQAFADLVAPLASLKQAALAGETSRADEGLVAFRREVDQRLTAAPGHLVSRVVGEILASCRETAWAAPQPVLVPTAEAWLEMVEFLVSLGRNADFDPTPGQRDALSAELGGAQGGLGPAQREALLTAHRTWLRVEGTWDTGGPLRRLPLRWAAARLTARALPPGRQVELPAEDGDLSAYARAALLVEQAQSGFDAWSVLARNPEVVLPVVQSWLGAPPGGRDHLLLCR